MTEAGIPVIETILSAMSTIAKLLTVNEQLGKIKTGKLADITAVDDNLVEKLSPY